MKQILLLGTFLLLIGPIVQAQPSGTPQKPETKPFVLGEVVELPSAQLAETRILNIYLPEGYHADDTTRYPVIYLLDGSADEDFIHIAGLLQYANFPWIDMLPKSILVGIANVDRRRDFTYPTTIEADKKEFPTTGGSEKFIAFLENEVQPYIENAYRTGGSQTIIGQSLGGLLATEILFKKPAMFTHYIIVSPSLWWDDESLLKYAPAFTEPERVHVAVGKEGEVMERTANELAELLKKDKSGNVQVSFQYLADEDHASIFHLAVYRAFQVMNAKSE